MTDEIRNTDIQEDKWIGIVWNCLLATSNRAQGEELANDCLTAHRIILWLGVEPKTRREP